MRQELGFFLYEQGRNLEQGEEGILSVLGHSRACLTPIPSPLREHEFSQFRPALGRVECTG